MGCDAVQLGRYVSKVKRSLNISPEHWYGVTSNQKAVYMVTVVRIYFNTVRESRRKTKHTNTHARTKSYVGVGQRNTYDLSKRDSVSLYL